MAAKGQASNPPTPVGSGFSDQISAMNIVYDVLTALIWREKLGEGQEVKVDLLAGMLAHQNQEMVMAMNFGEDFVRPNSGIGHPGMDAPFGVYPTQDGWVTIAKSPYRTLVGVLGTTISSNTTIRGRFSRSATPSGAPLPTRPAAGRRPR
jgi:crotonobetainyl-CoA:carnitine CoA-transferase CaiB-like acyl-CoA transferase